MKKMITLSSFLLCCFCACKNNSKTDKPENDVDAARSFIRFTMDGDYDKARSFMLPDSQNNQELSVYERYYKEKMKPEEKLAYKNASIYFYRIKNENDSTTVISYSNSYYKKDTHQLKVMKVDDRWLVDFKSYFKSKQDSLP